MSMHTLSPPYPTALFHPWNVPYSLYQADGRCCTCISNFRTQWNPLPIALRLDTSIMRTVYARICRSLHNGRCFLVDIEPSVRSTLTGTDGCVFLALSLHLSILPSPSTADRVVSGRRTRMVVINLPHPHATPPDAPTLTAVRCAKGAAGPCMPFSPQFPRRRRRKAVVHRLPCTVILTALLSALEFPTCI